MLLNKTANSSSVPKTVDLEVPVSNPPKDVVMEPYEYLVTQPNDVAHTKLFQAFDYWLRLPKEHLELISETIVALQNASLLLDDVEDGSSIRRGMPAAHHVFGIAKTINCASYVAFIAISAYQKTRPNTSAIFLEEIVNLHRGQGMEIHWRDSFTCPTEDEYIEMVKGKTSGLLVLAVRLMQEASNSTADYTDLACKVGIHLQIRDDYMNLHSEQYTENKGFCEDLTEGKFSFPIIHSLHANPGDHQLLDILKQHTESVEAKKFALQLMEKTNTFEYCRKYLHKLEQEIRDEIKARGGNPLLEQIMDFLSVPLK